MSGYQEIITDPSYAGQIISFTYPHIGNYGVTADDDESRAAFCRGVIVRDLARRHSNHRAEGHLESLLRRHDIPGIAGIDTRRLTRLIRDTGAMPGAFGDAPEPELRGGGRRRTRHARRRSGRARHGARPVPGRRHRRGARPVHRRLRLRHQDDDPATPLTARPGRGGSGIDVRCRCPRPPTRRGVPLERPRRPDDGAVRRRPDRTADR